jgi:methionyl-tRNA formyltransferase
LTLRLALVFQDGNFVGREYFGRLTKAGFEPSLLAAVGRMSPESAERETARTGGLWQPDDLPTDRQIYRFEKPRDPALWQLVASSQIDFVVQGGIGIIGADACAAPRYGILNVHPGKLPQYRGNMCPERAILNGDPVWASAHLIDAGIDTGPTIVAREYRIDPDWIYEEFRANLYAHCSNVLIEALKMLSTSDDPLGLFLPQDAAGAAYWPPLSDAELVQVRAAFPRRSSSAGASADRIR